MATDSPSLPSPPRKLEEIPIEKFNRDEAFLLYTSFTGDIEKTAHALGVSPVDVLRIADEDRWTTKLGKIIELQKSSRPGDIERGINRALNFVQAHRMRSFLQKIIQRVTTLNDDEIEDYIFTEGTEIQKDGAEFKFKKLSTRALADLTSALEKCHALTYLALNDTVQDRTRRKEQATDDSAAGDLSIRIAEAMAQVGESNSVRARLFDAQLQVAAVQKDKMLKNAPVEDPYNRE